MVDITLTTDFGTRDGFVGALKGKMKTLCPAAHLIDMTHDIPPFGINTAYFTLKRYVRQFTPDSVHAVVVDPTVGSGRKILLAISRFGRLIVPDNGLVSALIISDPDTKIRALDANTEYWQAHHSFDGLHVIAPAAAHIAAGIDVCSISSPFADYQTIDLPSATRDGDEIHGEVVTFDIFGNAITNIEESMIEKDAKLFIRCQDHHFTYARAYSLADDPEGLAIINSDGFLELAMYKGSLKDAYDFIGGETVIVEVNPV